MRCPHCGQEHEDQLRYCPVTGREITAPRVCPHCGAAADPAWQFCSDCGRSLAPPETGSVQPPAPIALPVAQPARPPAPHRPALNSRWLLVLLGAAVLVGLGVVWFNRPGQNQSPSAPGQVPIPGAGLPAAPDGTDLPAILPVVSTAPLGKIAFVSDRDGGPEIYVMEADGSRPTRLTDNFDRVEDDFPEWSPDGQKIAFVSNRDQNPEIYVMDAGGGNQTNLSRNERGDTYPAWSPDGRKIAFVSDRDGPPQIYVMNADGSDQVLVPNTQVDDFPAGRYYGSLSGGVDVTYGEEIGISWSPDGQSLVYNSSRSGAAKIYRVNLDGSQQTILAEGESYEYFTDPDWLADGQKIAYVADPGMYPQIFSMNPDGSGQTALMEESEDNPAYPAWSGDGQKIVFQADRDDQAEIFVLDLASQAWTRLTDHPAQDTHPDWAPVSVPAEAVAVVPGLSTDTGGGAMGEMVEVPAGFFEMGCDPEQNVDTPCPGGLTLHKVNLDTYWIDRYEVTNAGYAGCVAAGGCTVPAISSSATRSRYYGNPEYATYPMINVSWEQANAYCVWAGKRLPTEAEWEKAARGPVLAYHFPWGKGNPDCSLANYGGSEGCLGDTSPVDSQPSGASPYGALNMLGNVWEWVADWWMDGYYEFASQHNPLGPATGSQKVARGGDWQVGYPNPSRYSSRNTTGYPEILGLAYRRAVPLPSSGSAVGNPVIDPDRERTDTGIRCASSTGNPVAGAPVAAPTAGTVGEPVEEIPAPPAGTGNLAGRVTWDDQPVPGAQVRLCTENTCNGPVDPVTTDSLGWFVFAGIPPDAYSAQVHSLDPQLDKWLAFFEPAEDRETGGYFDYTASQPNLYHLGKDETLRVGDLPVFKTDLVQTFPAPGEEIRQGLPTLTWEAYPGAAYYGIYFGQSLYLSTSDVGYPRLPDVAEKVLGPAYPISRPLPGCQYTWKVEAYNARGVKISESAANDRVFTLSGQASSCTIQLSSPVDDAVINEGEPITFTWQGQAPYFYLSINDTHYRANGAAYTLAEGLPVGEYAWKVTAYDEDRQVAESGGTFTFRVVGAGAPSTGQTPGAEETTPSPVAATPATTQPVGDLIDETGWIEIVYSGMVDPSQDEPTELGQALVFHGPGSVGVGFACSGCIILEPSPNLTLLVPAEDQAEGGTVFHSGEEYQYRIKATPTGRTLDDIFLGSLPVYAVSYLERLK